MSKAGIQTQRPVGWAAEYVARSRCAFWMGIDNYPDLPCHVLGRINWPQDDVDRVVTAGAAGAVEVWEKARPIVLANCHVYAWVLLNEASIWSPPVRAGFPAFNRKLTSLLKGVGTRHVAGNVNVGHPSADYWDAGIRAIGEAAMGAYALGLHGYSWPSLEEGWVHYVGRYEAIYQALRAQGYNPPPCLMTELGLDAAVANLPHAGWQRVPLSPQQFADQVARVESCVSADGDLLGMLLFVAGAYEPWISSGFEITEDAAMRIADAVAQVLPIPPTPSLEPTPPQPPGGDMKVTIYNADGVQVDEEYLRATWGNVAWCATDGALYDELALIENFSGSSTTSVAIQDKDGKGIEGREVHCLNGGDAVGHTNAAGEVGFPWGGGSYYPHGGTGPMTITAGGVQVSGLGWLRYEDGAYSNHYHLDLVLREPGPQPTPSSSPSASSSASPSASASASASPSPVPPCDWAWGVDVSEWQGKVAKIDWPKVKAAGASFAFIRASVCRSDGTIAKDPDFDRNWAGAAEAGLLRGAYHYFGPWADGQAGFFVRTVGGDRPEMGYWLDVEAQGLTPAKVQQGLGGVDRNAGWTCHVYTSNEKWPGGVDVTGRDLWVAHWDVDAPTLPPAWSDWTFWQHGKGAVPGIEGLVDLNYFHGTEARLRWWYGQGPSSSPSPSPSPPPTPDVEAAIAEGYAALDGIKAALRYLGEDV